MTQIGQVLPTSTQQFPGGVPSQQGPFGVVQPPFKSRRVRRKGAGGGKGKGKGNGRGKPPRGGGGGGGGSQQPVNPYQQFMPQVRAAAQLQYGGAQQALQTQGANIAPFFQQYLNQLQASQVAQQGVYDAAMVQSQANAQAARPGAPTGMEPTKNSDLAGQVREGMLAAFTELLRAQGATYNAAKEDQKVVGAAARLSAQTQNAQAKTDLKKEKGAFKVDYAEQLRQRAHTEGLENAAFGLDVAETKADVKNDRAQIRQDRREERQDRKEERRDRQDKNREVITSGPFSGYTKQQVRKMDPAEKERLRKESSSSGSPEKKSTFTPKETAANRVKLRQMVSRVRANDNGVGTYGQDTYRAMVDAGVDPVLARAAIAKALGKPIPSWAQRRLRKDYGITLKTRGKVVRPKPDTRGTGNVGNTPGPNGESRPN
jgi:hypothetical protein